MSLEKALKVLPLDEIQLTRLQSLSSKLVGLTGNAGVKTEHLSCLCDAQDQGFAVSRCGGELYPPGANNINSARSLTFDE
jgi:hypothetical protein